MVCAFSSLAGYAVDGIVDVARIGVGAVLCCVHTCGRGGTGHELEEGCSQQAQRAKEAGVAGL